MKYIIDIEDEYTKDWVNETPMGKELCMPISVPNRQRTYHVITGFKLESYTEPDRKAIEDEVWEFVKQFECMTFSEIEDCFDTEYEGVPFVANMFSYQEAKAKYDAWKKQKDEVHVGDEVKCYDTNGVVVGIDITPKNSGVYVVCRNGNTGYIRTAYVTKTGRHFDEVDELLKKMRGEQE